MHFAERTIMSDALAAIRHYVTELRGIDSGIDCQDPVMRCLDLLLSATGSKDYIAYLDLIIKKPSELDGLISTHTFATSNFFRNQPVLKHSPVEGSYVTGRIQRRSLTGSCMKLRNDEGRSG